MPRYRTIQCRHCGYMQLKRDTQCDKCGRMTARERWRWISAGVGALTVVGAYFWLQHVMHAIAVH